MKSKYINSNDLKRLKELFNIVEKNGKVYAETICIKANDKKSETKLKKITDVEINKVTKVNALRSNECHEELAYIITYKKGLFSKGKFHSQQKNSTEIVPENVKKEMRVNNTRNLCLQQTLKINDNITENVKDIEDSANSNKGKKVSYTEKRGFLGKTTSQKLTTKEDGKEETFTKKYDNGRAKEKIHYTKDETPKKLIEESIVTTFNESTLGLKILGLISSKLKDKLISKKTNKVSKLETSKIELDKKTGLKVKNNIITHFKENGDTIENLRSSVEIRDQKTGNIEETEVMQETVRDINGNILQVTKPIKSECENGTAKQTTFYKSNGQKDCIQILDMYNKNNTVITTKKDGSITRQYSREYETIAKDTYKKVTTIDENGNKQTITCDLFEQETLCSKAKRIVCRGIGFTEPNKIKPEPRNNNDKYYVEWNEESVKVLDKESVGKNKRPYTIENNLTKKLCNNSINFNNKFSKGLEEMDLK